MKATIACQGSDRTAAFTQLEVSQMSADCSVSSLGSLLHESRSKRLHGRHTFRACCPRFFFFFAGVMVPLLHAFAKRESGGRTGARQFVAEHLFGHRKRRQIVVIVPLSGACRHHRQARVAQCVSKNVFCMYQTLQV